MLKYLWKFIPAILLILVLFGLTLSPIADAAQPDAYFSLTPTIGFPAMAYDLKPGDTFTIGVNVISTNSTYVRARISLPFSNTNGEFSLQSINTVASSFDTDNGSGMVAPSPLPGHGSFGFMCLYIDRKSSSALQRSSYLGSFTFRVNDNANAGTFMFTEAYGGVCSDGIWESDGLFVDSPYVTTNDVYVKVESPQPINPTPSPSPAPTQSTSSDPQNATTKQHLPTKVAASSNSVAPKLGSTQSDTKVSVSQSSINVNQTKKDTGSVPSVLGATTVNYHNFALFTPWLYSLVIAFAVLGVLLYWQRSLVLTASEGCLSYLKAKLLKTKHQ